jgi:hypothetical protein
MESAPDRHPIEVDELRHILGDCDEATLMRVRETGATAPEVLEAMQWLRADDNLGTELEHGKSGVVAQVYDILLELEAPAEER